jgi:hypothetical protein
MLRHFVFVAGLVAAIGMMPISASAQTCQGLLSWLCFNGEPAAKNASDDPSQQRTAVTPCLSREQVTGGYPRYRVINGRHCWYASTRNSTAKRQAQAKPAKLNVNPYNDPIWKGSDVSGNEVATISAQDCQDQALKLDYEEKQTFLKQCMSNKMR